MWVVHKGLLLRLPWRAWVCPCEGQVWRGAAGWVVGVLAAPGTREGWRLGQREIQCSRRVWQPVLANMLQDSCLENPLSDREAWQATGYRVAKSLTGPTGPCAHKHKTFFFWPVAALPQGELSVKVEQLLGLRGPWRPGVQGHRPPPGQDFWPCQSLLCSSTHSST